MVNGLTEYRHIEMTGILFQAMDEVTLVRRKLVGIVVVVQQQHQTHAQKYVGMGKGLTQLLRIVMTAIQCLEMVEIVVELKNQAGTVMVEQI